MPDKLQSRKKNSFSIFLMERPYYTLKRHISYCKSLEITRRSVEARNKKTFAH